MPIVVGQRRGLFGFRSLGGGPTIQVEGIENTVRLVQELGKENKKALRKGMEKAGRFLLARSKELVPVATGKLKRSGQSKVLNDSSGMPRYIVSYATPYALYVHEDLDAFHEVGQAKFLEKPAREYRLTLIHMIKEEVRKSTRRVGRMRLRGRR